MEIKDEEQPGEGEFLDWWLEYTESDVHDLYTVFGITADDYRRLVAGEGQLSGPQQTLVRLTMDAVQNRTVTDETRLVDIPDFLYYWNSENDEGMVFTGEYPRFMMPVNRTHEAKNGSRLLRLNAEFSLFPAVGIDVVPAGNLWFTLVFYNLVEAAVLLAERMEWEMGLEANEDLDDFLEVCNQAIESRDFSLLGLTD